MDPSNSEVAHEFLPLLKIYKDGRVERLIGTDTVPPSTDSITCVTSKDIAITQDVSARLYLPNLTNPNQKLPVVVYFHGGAFCVNSTATTKYHKYLNTIVSQAKVLAVSVEYRKAPEHPIPTAYEDSWEALQWVVSHNNEGPEPWLNDHGDLSKLFLAGDSSGANIAHNMAIVAGHPDFELSSSILGMALVHPYFWGSEPIGSEALDPVKKESVDRVWPFICQSNPDNDDPRVNPMADGALSLVGLGCRRVLVCVCVAEMDALRDRGRLYYEALGRSGWMGVVEIMETEERDHAFHLNNLDDEKAYDVIKRLVSFFGRDMPPLL